MIETSVQNTNGLHTLTYRTLAIIPAYNEERLIGSVVLKARKHFDAILVVDDGSADATAEIAQAAGALVVRHEKNRGKGAAVNTGFLTARTMLPEVVVMMDADGQHLPDEAPRVMQPILDDKADIVIGSRYIEPGSDVPTHRIWGHRVFNFMTSRTSGVHVSDSQSGYRAFSSTALDAINFSSNGFSVESEMQYLACDHNLRVVEVPITILYHAPPKRHVINHGLKVLNGMLRLIGQYRPLLFFGVPGMFLSFAGVLWGLWVIDIYQRLQTLAIGYALISAMLVIVGMLTLFTGIMLHSVRAMLIEYRGK